VREYEDLEPPELIEAFPAIWRLAPACRPTLSLLRPAAGTILANAQRGAQYFVNQSLRERLQQRQHGTNPGVEVADVQDVDTQSMSSNRRATYFARASRRSSGAGGWHSLASLLGSFELDPGMPAGRDRTASAYP
jgi:hypothetical protein